jgi:hypothetical protein
VLLLRKVPPDTRLAGTGGALQTCVWPAAVCVCGCVRVWLQAVAAVPARRRRQPTLVNMDAGVVYNETV